MSARARPRREVRKWDCSDDGRAQRTEAQEGEGARVLGLVADPDMPTQVGTRLAGKLTDWLGENSSGEWTLQVVSDPVATGETDPEQILDATANHRARND